MKVHGRNKSEIIDKTLIKDFKSPYSGKEGISFEQIKIKAGEKITISFEAKIKSIAIGEQLINEVAAFSVGLEDTLITSAKVENAVEKEVKKADYATGENWNIIFVMDYSWSEFGPGVLTGALQDAHKAAIDALRVNLAGAKVNVGYITFGIDINYRQKSTTDNCDSNSFSDIYDKWDLFKLSITGGTNYVVAFERAYDLLAGKWAADEGFLYGKTEEEMKDWKNVVLFMADGAPTPSMTTSLINAMTTAIQGVLFPDVDEKLAEIEEKLNSLNNWFDNYDKQSVGYKIIHGAEWTLKQGQKLNLETQKKYYEGSMQVTQALVKFFFGGSTGNLIQDGVLGEFLGLVGGAIDTVASSWLEMAMTDEDEYAWRVLLFKFPEWIVDIINTLFKGTLSINTWVPSGIFDQIPELLWNEILERTDKIKDIPNTEIYSTLIADSDTTIHGIKKTSSYFEKITEENPDKYWGWLTDPSQLKDRLVDIIYGLRESVSATLGTTTGGTVDVPNYSKIKSILLGAIEISKDDAELYGYIKEKPTGSDEGELNLKEIAKDYLSDDYILNEVVNIEYNP